MSALNKKLFRDIWKTKGQIVAIITVITCGILVFVSFYSCYRNLLLSRDAYYDAYRFFDFVIQLERVPNNKLFKIKELPNIKDVRGRIVKDVSLEVEEDDESKIGRIISLPADKKNNISDIYLKDGRKFSKENINECVVNEDFFKANKLKLGDKLTVITNGKKRTLKVVGTALSPEYIYSIRNIQELYPNPRKFGIIWVNNTWSEISFNMQGYSNEIVGEVYNSEEKVLDELLDDIEDTLKSYGVYAKVKRKDQMSNNFLSSEIDGLKVSAQVTPVIFLGVAAVILLIILSRMVKKERTQIGLLKAYGYSNLNIASLYFKYSMVVGLSGGLLGYFLGQMAGKGLMKVYAQYFTLPVIKYIFYADLFVQAILISTFCSAFSAFYAIKDVIKIQPAESMREQPPKSASKTLIEKIDFIWTRVSFPNRIIVRNISRYPFRALFTVIGVVLSTVIILLGYFMTDAIGYMLDLQFNKIQKEDVRIMFYLERDKSVLNEVKRFPNVRKAEPLLMQAFELKNGFKKKELLITGVPDKADLFNVIDTDGNVTSVKEGLTIMEQTARDLNLNIGDTVTLKSLMGKVKKEKKVKVSNIIQLYFGTGAYMKIDELSRLLDESFVLNTVLLKLKEPDMTELNKYLKDVPAVAVIEDKQETIKNLNETMAGSMGASSFILTLFAGIIAVSVIYNSTVINLAERNREISSLKVLGFTENEISKIIFNENFYLSFFGLLIGLPLGRYLCSLMVTAYDTEIFRFPFYISFKTYIYSSLTIMVYVFGINYFMKKKLKKIDMVESLKARE